VNTLSIAILVSLAGLSLCMAAAWAHQRSKGNGGIADAYWSFGLGAAGVFLALAPLTEASQGERQWLVASLVALWSLRLGLHIVFRHKGAAEDPRYAELRKQWGQDFQPRLFSFLQIQALVGGALVLSILLAAHHPRDALDWRDALGAALLLAGILGEALADRQLTQFRKTAPKGSVCDTGLWKYSRHPNYFFEWLGWLAYPVIALDLTGAYPWGVLALSGPVLMYWLLVHVSGIPPLEAHMLRSRGAAFKNYQSRVNAFFPGAST